MENRIALYPLLSVAAGWDDEPFDRSVLPIQIVPTVTIEDAKSLFREDQFDWLTHHLSKQELDTLKSIRHGLAIVHRYQPDEYDSGSGGQADQKAEVLVRNVAACLRLIRPTGQTAGFMRGTEREDLTFHEDHFENPAHFVNVPDVQKLFSLRTRDLTRLQTFAQMFLVAMCGGFGSLGCQWNCTKLVIFRTLSGKPDSAYGVPLLKHCSLRIRPTTKGALWLGRESNGFWGRIRLFTLQVTFHQLPNRAA